MQHFLWPPSLSVNLHVCPERERDRWSAELDLDPTIANKLNLVVCSLHFRDGYPTKDFPYPTELLGETTPGHEPTFKGRMPSGGGSFDLGNWSNMEAKKTSRQILDDILNVVDKYIEQSELINERKTRLLKEQEERRRSAYNIFKGIRYTRIVRKTSLSVAQKQQWKFNKNKWKSLKFKTKKGLKRYDFPMSAGLSCKFCKEKFGFTKALFYHVKSIHITPMLRKKSRMIITEEEKSLALQNLYPTVRVSQLDSKKKYVCAVCKSVCDLYGLFIHMKTVHQGLLCQYCLKLFKKVRDLESHLASVHRVGTRYYSDGAQLSAISGANFSLACGDCNMLVTASMLDRHVCRETRTFTCPITHNTFHSKAELETNLVSSAAKNFHLRSSQGMRDGDRERAVLYETLTGKQLKIDCQADTFDLLGKLKRVIGYNLEPLKGVNSVNTSQHLAKKKSSTIFSCSDRSILSKYGSAEINSPFANSCGSVLEDIPKTGLVFIGSKSRGINNHTKKKFKDLGISLDLNVLALTSNISIHEDISNLKIQKAGTNIILGLDSLSEEEEEAPVDLFDEPVQHEIKPVRVSRRLAGEMSDDVCHVVPEVEKNPRPKTAIKTERMANVQRLIKEGLEELRAIVDLHRDCLFCQQCRTVWVEATFLLSHMIMAHGGGEREESIISAIKKYHKDTRGKEVMFRYETSPDYSLDTYSCSYCLEFTSGSYTDLFVHTATAHGAKVLTCTICQNMFLNYGSLISHVCNGPPTSTTARARFACKMCNKMDLSSFLEFQLHIRFHHHTCEICFKNQGDQETLYNHCGTHEQDLMCMKCFVTFERPESFKKHLHSKHGSEVVACGQCWAPTWPHVYHFCLPDLPVSCPTCEAQLPNSAAYRVHQRKHTGATPHICGVCSRGFISKSLLWKHMTRRHPDQSENAREWLRERRLRRDTVKFGASDQETVEIVGRLTQDILNKTFSIIEMKTMKESEGEEPLVELEESDTRSPLEEEPVSSPVPEVSALDAAILSIMPQEQETTIVPDSEASVPQQTDREAVKASLAGRTYTEDNSWQAGLDALLAGAATSPIPNSSPSPQKSQQSPETSDQSKEPVLGGLWNQDLMFIGSKESPRPKGPRIRAPHPSGGGIKTLGPIEASELLPASPVGVPGIRSLNFTGPVTGTSSTSTPVMTTTQWNLDLSEESDDEEYGPKEKRTPAMKARTVMAPRPLLDHDYCYHAFVMSQQPVQPLVAKAPELSEMDKILSNVAFGGYGDNVGDTAKRLENEREKKKKKKKKKKRKRKEVSRSRPNSSSDTDSDNEADKSVDIFGIQARHNMAPDDNNQHFTPFNKKKVRPKKLERLRMNMTPGLTKRGPRPKYHTPDAAKAQGVMAGTARPSFDTDSSGHGMSDENEDKVALANTVELSETEMSSSDFDTDFSAEDQTSVQPQPKTTAKQKVKSFSKSPKPALKLKIKLPPQPDRLKPLTDSFKSGKKRKKSLLASDGINKPLGKRLRESISLNIPQKILGTPKDNVGEEKVRVAKVNTGFPGLGGDNDRKLYCICRAPHDEVSELL